MSKQRLKALLFTGLDNYLLWLGNSSPTWVLVSVLAKVHLHGAMMSRCIQSFPLHITQ